MSRTRSLAGLLALLCALLSVGVQVLPAQAGTSLSNLTGYGTSSGGQICDIVNEINPPYADVACASGSSAFVGTDGSTVAFGLVTEVDPRTTGNNGPLESSAYVVAIGVNGTQVATVGVDGKNVGGTDYIYAKCFGNSTLTYNTLVTTATSNGTFVVTPVGQYFRVDFTIPLTALAGCGITATTPVQLYYGSSQASNLDVINKDLFRTGDSGVSFGGLTTATFGGALSMAKTATAVSGPNPPAPGQTTTYDLAVTATNTSVYPVSGVSVVDDLPTGVTLLSRSAPTGSITVTGQHVVWSGFDLIAGASATMTLRVSITPGANAVGQPVLLNPGATGSGSRGDGVAVSATSNGVSSGVVSGPVLTIAKSAAPTFVAAGGTVGYTITVGNTGTASAAVTSVVDTLPSGFTFVAGSTGGTLGATAPTLSGSTVTWSGAFSLPANTTRTLTFSATAPSTPGSYPNTATVNASNAPAASTGPVASVTVNSPPTANLDSASTARNTAVSIGVLANDTDPDASNTLQVTAIGTPTFGTAVLDAATQRIVYTPPTGFTGTATFGYTIGDGFGGTSSSTVTVTVPNGAPVANPDSLQATPGVSVPVDVLANDTDPDNDPRTVTSVSTAAHGTTSLVNGVVSYTASTSYVGADSFTYTISDGHGGTATGTVNVTIPNTPPTAVDDGAATSVDRPVTIAVLSNDSDPNTGQTLSVSVTTPPASGTTSVAGGQITYTPATGFLGTDGFDYTLSDGTATSAAHVTVNVSAGAPIAVADSASTNTDMAVGILVTGNDAGLPSVQVSSFTQPVISGVGPPANVSAGTTATTDNQTITYTPAAGFTGTATFTYTVTNGTTTSAPATVTLTVRNAPPVAVADNLAVTRAAAQPLDVLVNDTDANGDVLRITGVSGVSAGASVTVDATGPRDVLLYTPPPGFPATDSFSYTVDDGRGGTSTAVVTVSIANGVPVAGNDTASPAASGPVTVAVLANDTDPDNDPLTVSVTSAPSNGAAVVNPNGTITYTPTAAFAGTDTFTYTVDDGHSGTATATVSVTTPNTPPVAVTDSVTTVVAAPVTIDVVANDTDVNTAQTLTVTGVGMPAHGTAVLNPDGTVTYTPTGTYRGPDSFTYTVTDGTATTTGTVQLTVTQRPPVAIDDVTTTATNTARVVPVLANDTDADGDPLAVVPGSVTDPVIVVPVGPSGVTSGTTVLNPNNTVTFTPAAGFRGTVRFQYAVTDGTAQATGTVTVDVLNAPPAAVDDSVPNATRSAAQPIDVLANDSDANADPLTITAVSAPASGAIVTIDRTGARDRLLYTPPAGFTGADSFSYTISDGAGGTSAAVVRITVNDNPPVAVADSITATPGLPLTVPVLANDTDADLDPLTVTAVSPASHGVVVLNGAGQVVYTPTSGYVGPDSFTYTVSDGHGGTDVGTVSVTVPSAPPAPTPSPTVSPTPPAPIIAPSVSPSPPAPPVIAPPVVVPPVVVPPAVGPPLPTPAPVIGPTAPANRPPAYTDAPANTTQTVEPGADLAPLAASDPDGDRLSYTLIDGALPPGVTLNLDGSFLGSATGGGSFPVTLRVCDDRTPALCSLTRLVIRVAQPVLGPPTAPPAVPPAPTPAPPADGRAVVVNPAPVREALPRTGAPLASLFLTGLASTLIGLGFSVVGRRRRAT